MLLTELDALEEREIVPGYNARFVHSDKMTVAFWRVEEGATLPEHAHVHEQISNLVEGRFEMMIGGEITILEPGKVVTIPSNVPHSGKALTPCRIIDIFHPVREDYR